MEIAVGESISGYRVLSTIGAGGMGKMYLAEQPVFKRKVALKVIHRELAGNHEIVTRFFNEARAVNQIGNEHIVEINDLGQAEGGEYFFVMEYLDGRTLAQDMAEAKVLDVGRALHIAAQIADALEAAHLLGIIHRDLKPDNIMLLDRLGDADYVKVLDFGLAKIFSQADAGQPLTAQGVILGTPQYMAPEACESKAVDRRADIYSLGVLLFQMVTGYLPFEGVTMGAVLIKQVRELPPAPRGLNADIPPAVEQIILRCLAKSPDARFYSMAQLRHALLDPDRYLASGPPVMPAAAAVNDSDNARTLIRQRPSLPRLAVSRAPTQQPPARALTEPRPGGRESVQRMPQPVVPKNMTVRLAEPPPLPKKKSRTGLWIAAMAIPAIVGFVGVALISDDDNSTKTPAAVDAGIASQRPDARPAVPDAGAARDVVRLHFDTIPQGAKVLDENGKVLGVTPATVELPRDGVEHVLTFRHQDALDRQKTVTANGDGKFEIELELRPRGTRKPE